MKELELLLNFALDFKTDKAKVQRLSKEIETLFSKINPEVDINDKAFKQTMQSLTNALTSGNMTAEQLSKTLQSMEIGIDSEEVTKAFKDIDKLANEIVKDIEPLQKAFDNIDTNTLEKSLLEVEKAMQSINPDEFKGAIGGLAGEYDKSVSKATSLIDTNKKAQAVLKASGKDGSEAYKRLQKEIDGAEKELEQLGVKATQTKSFMDKMSSFGMAVQGIEQITNTLGTMQQPFIELDKQVRNIGTLGVQNFREFSDAAVDMSKRVPDSAGAIAQGIYEAISAGTIKVTDGMANVTEGMIFVETASKLATAGLTDTQSAINGLTTILNAYKLQAGDAEKISDMMFNTVNAGKVSVTELNSSLAQVVPTAAATGVNFEQLGGAIATMTKQGVPASQATTKLNQVLVELQKPGAELKKIMEAAGVSMQSLKAEGLQATLKKLGEAMEKEGKTANTYFGSVEAAAGVTLLSGQNAKMAAEDLEFVAKQMGTTESAFSVASESIETSTSILMNNVQAAFNGVMGVLGPFGNVVLNSAKSIAPMVTSVIGLSNLLSTDMAKGLVQHIKGLKNLNAATIKATAAQIKQNMAILANPYVLAVAAIAALVIGMKALRDSMTETAQERLDEAESEKKLLQVQMDAVNQRKKIADSNIAAVNSFKEQGKAAMENTDLIERLARAYPGVIDMNKSYEENLKSLTVATQGARVDLVLLDKDLQRLESRQVMIDLKINKEKVNVEAENITDIIEDEKTSWYRTLSKFTEEALFGSSWESETAKNFTEPYVKAMKQAGNDSELALAKGQFLAAIYDPKNNISVEGQKQAEASVGELANKITEKFNQAAPKVQKSYEELMSLGHSEESTIALIKTQYGLTEKQIKEMVKQQKLSTNEAEKQKTAAENLADAWKKAKQGTDEAVTNTLDQLNAIDLKLRDETQRAAGDTKDSLMKQRDELIKTGTVKVKEQKTQEKINEQNKIALGLGEKTKGQAVDKNNLIKEEYDLKNRILDFEFQKYKYAREKFIIDKGSQVTEADSLVIGQKQVDTIKQQKANLEELLKLKLNKADRQDVQEKIQDLNQKLLEEQTKVSDIAINLKLKDDELKQQIFDLEQQKIEYEISIGVKDENALTSLIDEYKGKLATIPAEQEKNNKELKDINSKYFVLNKTAFTDEEKKRLKLAYDMEVQNVEQKNVDLKKKEFEYIKTIADYRERITQAALEKQQEAEEMQLGNLEKQYEKERAVLDKFNQYYINAVQERYQKSEESASNSSTEREQDRLNEVQKLLDDELISDTEFERRKTQIAADGEAEREAIKEDFRQRALRMEAMQQGMAIEAERKNELTKAQIQADSLQAQIKIYEDKWKYQGILSLEDTKALENLKAQFGEASEIIEINSTQLTKGLDIAGEGVAEALTNLFAGNPEAAADAIRGTFATIFGVMVQALQKQLQGAVLDLLLSWFSSTEAKLLPWYVRFGLLPVMQGVISGALQAVADPILNGLMSFSTGGMVTSPTMAVVGDASKLGGSNKEWIFRDEQLAATIQMASASSNAILIGRLSQIGNLIASQQLTTRIKGSDIELSLNRTQFKSSSRRGY